MGKVNLNQEQAYFLKLVAAEKRLSSVFYLTGGTSLSAFYYNHRYSEDIDLFTDKPYDQDFVRAWMNKEKTKHKWQLKYTQVFERQTYEISTKRFSLKAEFVHYPYRQLEAPTENYHGILIDSKADIAVNKLLTISQRTTTKDFVDLYFLLQKDFSWWDLMHGVEKKFGIEIDKIYLSSLLTKTEDLNSLPRMKEKLTIEELKTFFQKEAKKLALTMVRE